MTAASFFSLLIKVSTLSTVIPAFLVGGSSTLTTVLRGFISMERDSTVMVSRGFFLAFMILGRVGYLGSFKRRSADKTAGSWTVSFSEPFSVSRSTDALIFI